MNQVRADDDGGFERAEVPARIGQAFPSPIRVLPNGGGREGVSA
jgi:hypothetical protein